MNLRRLAHDLPLYLRATSITAELRFRLYARKTFMMAFALAVAVIGGVMLNIAAFRALELVWGPVWTPLALAGINFAMAALLLASAASAMAAVTSPSPVKCAKPPPPRLRMI